MKRKILIAGVNGLIGSKLASFLSTQYEIYGLVRNIEKSKKLSCVKDYISWGNDENELVELISKMNVVINLSGSPIAKGRWTKKNKERIYTSRINTTRKLAELILKSENKPELFINASAVGYYGLDQGKVSDESTEPGNDFLSKVCIDWENASAVVDSAGIRRVNIRISTVLSRDGGALPLIALPFKFFLGTYFGTGNQQLPWIHEKDLIRLFEFVIKNQNIQGPINAVSPNSVSMKEFCKILGKVLNRLCWIRVPEWKMKLLFGEMSTLLIHGGKVIPKKAMEHGFKFEFENLEDALRNLFMIEKKAV